MKNIFVKILAFSLAAILCFASVGCKAYDKNDAEATQETMDAAVKPIYRIDYKTIDFVSDTSVKALRDSLFKLLSNTRIPYGEKGEYMGEKVKDPDSPSVPRGYSYGLLDLDFNGVPELVIDLGGGSAGNAYYEAYDIPSGRFLGSFDGGHADEWCVYFCTDTGDFRLYGQFWHRIGWSGRIRYIVTMEYDTQKGEFYDASYLRSYHEIAMAEESDDVTAQNGTFVTEWVEKYPDTQYYLYGQAVSFDDYYAELDRFNENTVRVSETGLKLFSIWDYELEGDELYAALADDLVNTSQKFIDTGKK